MPPFLSLSHSNPLSFSISMASQQPPTWVPLDPPPDCSQGFCTIYCPQWCNMIYTPPPPFDIIDDDDSSSDGPTFSPLVIAIIGILAAAFLLVTYYTIISKYCVRLRLRREHHRHRHRPPPDPTGDSVIDAEHETWYVSPVNGLDEALISKIAVCKYKRGDGLVEFTDCSVCLGEFREDESLRLLPKCSHAFHIQCIDTWLKSHSNCPICRANVMSMSPSQPQLVPPPPPPPPPPPLPAQTEEVVVAVENMEEELSTSDCNSDGSKEALEGEDKDNRSIRRSFSMGSSVRDRVSVADILQVSIEDEYNMAKEKGLLVESCSSSRGDHRGESQSQRSRNLLTAMSPVPMKRSMSSGRFGLSRQGKGRNLVLPL